MNITSNRLSPPAELPDVTINRAMAREFFSGWWAGIAVGAVIGAGVIVGVLA
jgi:hypothetical protein